MRILDEIITKTPEILLPVDKKYIEANAAMTDNDNFVIEFEFMDRHRYAGDSIVFSSPEQVEAFGLFLTNMAKDLKNRVNALKDLGKPAAYFMQQQFSPEQPDYNSGAAGEESRPLQDRLDL